MNLLESPPDDETLRAFLLGTLPPDLAASVSTWVETDPTAVDRLNSIDAHDTVVDAIENAADTPTWPYVASQNVACVAESHAIELPSEVGGYRILGELGRGGMGVVLEAEDKHLIRRVAIKIIATTLAGSPSSRDRFLREARAVATVEHENVVPILHVGEDSGQLYIVMPLLKGETLHARLQREKQLPVCELVRIGREVAAGLAAAHSAGLVHRDVKPGNIWLEAGSGRVKLLDFGLAKPLDRSMTDAHLTDTGAVMGTPHYMAPEQAEGKRVDSRADLFSLGAVLYHAATGRRPFQGDTKLAVLIAVLHETPPELEKLNASLSPEIVAIIRSLLEKDPNARPASAADVVTDLSRITPDAAPPDPGGLLDTVVSDTNMTQTAAKPRRWWPSVAICLGLLAAIGVGLAFQGGLRDKRPDDVAKSGEQLSTENTVVRIGTHDRRHKGHISEFDVSPALGLALTYSRSDGLKLWNTRDLSLVATGPMALFPEGDPYRVALLTREWAVAACGQTMWVLKLDGDKYTVHHTYDFDPKLRVHQLAASPNGKWVAVLQGNQVNFWTAEALHARRPPTAKTADFDFETEIHERGRYCRFGPDGRTFGLYVKSGVQLFQVSGESWAPTKRLPVGEVVFSFALDAAGTFAYSPPQKICNIRATETACF